MGFSPESYTFMTMGRLQTNRSNKPLSVICTKIKKTPVKPVFFSIYDLLQQFKAVFFIEGLTHLNKFI